MIRALHVLAGGVFGGVEASLLGLVRERALCPDLETSVAVCFDGRFFTLLREAGATPISLGPVRASRPWSVISARRRLKGLLEGFDVAVCHGPWAQALLGPAARRAGKPLAFWLHNIPDGRHWLERWASLTPPDLAICNSRFSASALPMIYPRVRAGVLHPSVPSPGPRPAGAREALRTELGVLPGIAVVLQAGRLEPLKGHALLLQALGSLREEPGWVCWIAGGIQPRPGPGYLKDLERLAGRLGISRRVLFLGERVDVPALLDAADLLCQPNVRPESFGIAMVEALHAGLPVVATAMGGAAEILDPSCGVLVPAGDIQALASALRTLLGDAAGRRRLGAEGPAHARTLCDPARQLARLHALLAGVCG